ncbi:uncharacterized protein LOC123923524 [Trifolium pratense]|uniref:uncharacterized protein LOC123923524 n=1 Tax=Trifolium pratense TaxID=57577 RepID=UPI001E69796D|nr:uncharacterized protein LOC123923524 [Trifolium pratense]
MKSFSKNKFFHCFRPVVDIDAMLESKVAAHCSESWFMQHPKKQTVSKLIKAVILETILNKRARHQNRYSLDCFGGSKKNCSTHKKESKASQSSLSTLSTQSSSFSSPKVSQLKNMSTKEKHEKESSSGSTLLEKQTKFELYAICLVLISLVFTVFWGKLCGIFLTSMCLYFFCLWNSNSSCQKMLLSCPKIDVKGDYGMCAQSEISLYLLRQGAHLAVKETKQIHS